jgi:hypothetical protein
VVQADTRTMNPSVPQSFVDEAYEADASNAAAEYGGEFRSDIESFISREVVEACVISGRYEIPPMPQVAYTAAIDAAGGSGGGDSMTVCVTHKEGEKVIVDAIREVKPPFSPEVVAADFATLLTSYRIRSVVGDKWAGMWPRERLEVHGVVYSPSARPKSDHYRDLLPILNGGRIELLDHQKTINQICSLERRTARGGRDQIDHPPGANHHDDLVNVLAIAATNIIAAPPMRFAPPPDWSKSAVGFDPSTGTIARNPALAHGPEYAGHDFVPHFSTSPNSRKG